MTYAQFKRLKPKYKRRILVLCVLAAALFIGGLYLISWCVNAIKVQFNTTTLKDYTAQTILEREGFSKILEVMGQTDGENILVMDSQFVMTWHGDTAEEGQPQMEVTQMTIHLTSLLDKDTETWTLTANQKKVQLRRTSQTYENKNTLAIRKVPLSIYYPALYRASTSTALHSYLTQNFPSGEGGQYLFADEFGDNVNPGFSTYLASGYTGLWVSKTGAVSDLDENYQLVDRCAPMLVSIAEVNQSKSKKNKIVLLEPVEKLVVLLQAANY